MKVLERVTIILFAVVLALFIAVTVYQRIILDTTAPEISCDSDVIEVSVADPESALLQGVTAKDGRDGDLTGSIMVKGVTGLITDNTAKVTYIVFDAANNMASCQRIVRYTDYEKPRFALSEPLIYPEGGPVTVLDRLTAADSAGEDISDNIRIVSQNISVSSEGTYSLTVQVTNSQGDVESLTLPVIISNASAKKPLITLRQYLVYLDAGSAFDAESYLSSVKDNSGLSYDKSHVSIQGYVDTGSPGSYNVSYSFQSYTVYLTVVVK